jgi:hypothetical protein
VNKLTLYTLLTIASLTALTCSMEKDSKLKGTSAPVNLRGNVKHSYDYIVLWDKCITSCREKAEKTYKRPPEEVYLSYSYPGHESQATIERTAARLRCLYECKHLLKPKDTNNE